MSEIALIGKKIGMTREFYKSGQLVPVTVLKMEKARVIQIIEEDTRGYKAVQLGYGKIKNSKLSKQMRGYFAKKNTEPKKIIKEYRIEKPEEFKTGNERGLEAFKDVNKKYEIKDIIKGDSIFCATGITSGDLVKGVKVDGNKYITETLITHKSSNLNKILVQEDTIKTWLRYLYTIKDRSLVPSSIG